MNPLDREEILKYLEQGLAPKRPTGIPLLMKTFLRSAYTYSPLRKHCEKALGEIPTPPQMGKLLSRVFSEEAFKRDQTWKPASLNATATDVQKRLRLDLDSREFHPRMLRVMLDGSAEMEKQLARGLDSFYATVDEAVAKGPEAMWAFIWEFQKHIKLVGHSLTCDFLKECGFLRFVKVDHHFSKQFPALLYSRDCSCRSPKASFLLSQELAGAIGEEPYYLDRILYEWGRNKKFWKTRCSRVTVQAT